MWLSPGTLVYSINKTDHHNIAEILLKVVLNTITLTPYIIAISEVGNISRDKFTYKLHHF